MEDKIKRLEMRLRLAEIELNWQSQMIDKQNQLIKMLVENDKTNKSEK